LSEAKLDFDRQQPAFGRRTTAAGHMCTAVHLLYWSVSGDAGDTVAGEATDSPPLGALSALNADDQLNFQ
jgi:hypothetical protein